MKAFKLLNLIIKNGIDNSVMTTYEHESMEGLHAMFGKEYLINGMQMSLKKQMLAVWSEKDGSARFLGIPDIVLTSSNNAKDKIYLYEIE